jgi:hypothetical protein
LAVNLINSGFSEATIIMTIPESITITKTSPCMDVNQKELAEVSDW